MLIGLLGGGFAGCELHLHTLSRLAEKRPRLEVVCAELNQARWPHLRRYSLVRRIYPDPQTLIAKEQLDGIIVALPTELHYRAALLIAANAPAGLAVLMEKPLASSLLEARAMAVLLERQRVLMGLTGRYHPEFVAARAALPRIGDIYQYQEVIALRFPEDGAETKLAQNQGVIRTFGVHTLDRVRNFFGVDPQFTTAVVTNLQWRQAGEDEAIVHGLAGKARLHLEWRWPCEECFDYKVVVMGMLGQIVVRGFCDATLHPISGADEVLFAHQSEASLVERHYPGFRAELEEFLSLVEHLGQQPSVTLSEGVAAQRLIEEMYSMAKRD